MTIGNPLPLLQDTTANRIWDLWGVTYRDVRILDSSNRLVAVYNLTSHDLTTPDQGSYNELLNLLITVANGGDSDQDGLPDAWENKYLKGLASGKTDDPDGDGFTNDQEFTFGSDPLDPASIPIVDARFNTANQFTIAFNRWAGTPYDYLLDTSRDLITWSTSGNSVISTRTNLFDGTGRLRATFTLSRSASTLPLNFIRTRVTPHP